MKLSDFYFEDKAQIGNHMSIMLPDGTDSGEWLNVVSPDADAAVKAGRAFIFKYRELIAKLKPLENKCKKNKDFLEYNETINAACADLNRELAAEVVNGWSLEEPFSKESLVKLLEQYRALGSAVAKFHNDQRNALQEK